MLGILNMEIRRSEFPPKIFTPHDFLSIRRGYMKQNFLLVISGAILALFVALDAKTFAQGCGQIVIEELRVSCCGGLYQQPDFHCGEHGSCSYFCYEGFGECCGASYGSANVVYDADCASLVGDCGDGGLWHPATCSCVYKSPILINVSGNGFHLTGLAGGVRFQFDPQGNKVPTSWTAPGADGDAFLVLDRNKNGVIDDGSELFGNFTPQPPSNHPNGFLALAVFDKPENGGNGDGILDRRDDVFASLQLWIDVNHDGISQASELHTLPELGVLSLSLHFSESRREDRFGNIFQYKAAVNPGPTDQQSRDGKWAYDVFFASDSANSSGSHRNGTLPTRRCPQSRSPLSQQPGIDSLLGLR